MEASLTETAKTDTTHVTRVAIPVFQRRIAPVFDACLRVLTFDVEGDHYEKKSELRVYGLWPSERVAALQRAGVTTLICAGISEVLDNMLEGAGIRVIDGIAGQIEDVLQGFISGRLGEPHFLMPGRSRVAKIVEAAQATISVATSSIREKGKKEGATAMTIAIPVAEGSLAAHFGHAPQFAIVQVENQEITRKNLLTPPSHEPGLLPHWLHQLGVEVIIAGRMGHRALALLGQEGIEVITSAPSLVPEELVHQYLSHTLDDKRKRV
ncbi:MAG: NifB/NifX family molybdenum-iron cluster-binding protein [Thermodesulfobacteriota bacterium]|nr:NifB/NifX family molybdenum-iron cluster-binding protein [Thermodesulfobacteriota bacterium]